MSRLNLTIVGGLLLLAGRPGPVAPSTDPAVAAVGAVPVQRASETSSVGPQPADHVLIVQSTGSCGSVRQQAPGLLRSIGASTTSAARDAARRLASTQTGSPTAQSWHDEAVFIYLRGNMPLASWAALTAATEAWQEVFIADAGIILLGLGRNREAAQFLRCANETGDRAPYVLEALAAAYERLGERSEARESIDQVNTDALDDPLMTIEKSLLDTGKPPPSGTDELQRCLSRLDRHMKQIVASVRRRDTLLDELLHTPNGHQLSIARFAKLRATYATTVRSVNAVAAARPNVVPFNSALLGCITNYIEFTALDIGDTLTLGSEGNEIFFWSNVVGMDAEAYVNDTVHNFTSEDRHVTDGPLNSISDFKKHQDDEITAFKQRTAGTITTATFCRQWQGIHDRLAETEQARYAAAAAQGFDEAAVQLGRAIEAEIADTRGFIAQEIRRLRPPVANWPKIASGNYDRAQAAWVAELTRYVQGLADEYQRTQRQLQTTLDGEQRNINQQCEKILNPPKVNQLAEDQWQKLMTHFSSSFDPTVDCIVKVDDAKLEFDENLKATLSAKWQGIGAKLDLSGSDDQSHPWKLQITSGPGGSQKFDVPGSGVNVAGENGQQTEIDLAQVSIGPKLVGNQQGQLVGAGVDAELAQGPITVKGGMTVLSDTNPNTGVNEPAIGFSGTAGLGAHFKPLGVKASIDCFPGKGTATVYPRGLVQDAIDYLAAASR